MQRREQGDVVVAKVVGVEGGACRGVCRELLAELLDRPSLPGMILPGKRMEPRPRCLQQQQRRVLSPVCTNSGIPQTQDSVSGRH